MVNPMNMLYPIKVNNFFHLVEKLCFLAKIKNTKSVFSKTMYGNIKLTFLVAYKEKLNCSYRRFTQICDENNIQRMLCLKKIPHYTTLQKFVQRTNKKIFEKLVKACHKLLNLKNIQASIDATGFSNTNPSHHYCKRIHKNVKNYTKTTFLTDNKTKLILNVKTVSDHTHDTLFFKPMVKELVSSLKLVLADKGYDSMENRKFCLDNNIEVQIPFREWSQTRKGYGHKPKMNAKRRRVSEKFDQNKYNKRSTIEAINSAIKRTLGSYVLARNASQQQKQVTLKALTYNIEHIGRTIKISILMEIQ
jgi:IS5 family transposase